MIPRILTCAYVRQKNRLPDTEQALFCHFCWMNIRALPNIGNPSGNDIDVDAGSDSAVLVLMASNTLSESPAIRGTSYIVASVMPKKSITTR